MYKPNGVTVYTLTVHHGIVLKNREFTERNPYVYMDEKYKDDVLSKYMVYWTKLLDVLVESFAPCCRVDS